VNARRHSEDYVRISGKQPVSEALSGGWPVREVVIRAGSEDSFTRDLLRKASALGIKASVVEAQSFDRKYPPKSQGVAATVHEVPLRGLDEVLEGIPAGEPPFFVALDGILDPHNLGAITRTALAMGVHAVVVPRHRSASIGEGAAKSSAGAVFREPICEVPNIHYFIEWAKRKGLWVFGLDAGGQDAMWTADLAGPIAIVVGSEGKGLARLTRERCDAIVSIPMSGNMGSLNASVACGMAIAEITRQRHQKASERLEKRPIDLR
jgi:23S rRNA (guanosine2251-2'-O)-methyltransferase